MPKAFLGHPQSPLCVRPPPTPRVGSDGAQTRRTSKRRLLLRVGSDFSPFCFPVSARDGRASFLFQVLGTAAIQASPWPHGLMLLRRGRQAGGVRSGGLGV